jgi:hypothetical protein
MKICKTYFLAMAMVVLSPWTASAETTVTYAPQPSGYQGPYQPYQQYMQGGPYNNPYAAQQAAQAGVQAQQVTNGLFNNQMQNSMMQQQQQQQPMVQYHYKGQNPNSPIRPEEQPQRLFNNIPPKIY